MSSSSLLSLPYELRQQILRHSLLQPGTIELQEPLWAGAETFAQPLFHTCRQVRDEALEDNDDDNDVVKGVETLSSPGYGEEVHAVVKLLPTDVKKENVVGCSTISAAESENCA